jgi:KaiC/GvpD/RAD55 family RecA-like ATPase
LRGEGGGGTGKTTLACDFLLEGSAAGEPNLYITLSETKDELLRRAASYGWIVGPDIRAVLMRAADSCNPLARLIPKTY